MKTLQIFFFTSLLCLAMSSCAESDCEMNNMGTVVIHNNSTSSKLWLSVDKKFGPGLSRADHQISAGENIRVQLPAGVHTLDGVYTTSLNGGTKQTSVDEKEFVLEQCDEVNVYFDL